MTNTYNPLHTPDIILIIGTDAAGKDHVANILMEMIQKDGEKVQKRKRFLSGKVTTAITSEGKTWVESQLEKLFLFLYPKMGAPLLFFLSLIIKWDLKRFKKPEGKLIVVGHNGLRGLGFYLGYRAMFSDTDDIPQYLIKTLKEFTTTHTIHTIVLDVEDHLRKKRIEERISRGVADNFDCYMLQDTARSESIENSLVQLTQQYLDASLIKNNDLSKEELKTQIRASYALSQGQEISLS